MDDRVLEGTGVEDGRVDEDAMEDAGDAEEADGGWWLQPPRFLCTPRLRRSGITLDTGASIGGAELELGTADEAEAYWVTVLVPVT